MSRWLGKFRRPREDGGADLPAPRRYLSDGAKAGDDYLRAAQEYVARKSPGDRLWLYRKPYDVSPENAGFYQEMYQVLNLLKAMDITPGGRVLEVGSGPGWVTEILMLLDFEVDAIEPSSDMIEIAKERIESAIAHHRCQNVPRISFHRTTLEECELPSDGFDAAVFHESLHHVVDELAGLRQVHRMLRPGGVVGVSEWAWKPGDKDLEALLDEEMRQYGTLENPYSQDYLEQILTDQGFVEITRYHGINGLFPVSLGKQTIKQSAEAPATATNNLTAKKPWRGGPTSRDHRYRTTAEIEVIDSTPDATGSRVSVRLRIRNSGETAWLKSGDRGVVRVALRAGQPGTQSFLEATPRHDLPSEVAPGDTAEVTLDFVLPETPGGDDWRVDLVNEQFFWFSDRGTHAPLVETKNPVA